MKNALVKLLTLTLITNLLLCGCKGEKVNDPLPAGTTEQTASQTIQEGTEEPQSLTNETSEPVSTEQTTAAIETEPETQAPEEKFEWTPIVSSGFYEKYYSKEHITAYENCVNAIMSYSESFEIPDGVEWWEVEEFLRYLFPSYFTVVSEVVTEGNQATISYISDQAATEKLLQEFGSQVEWWINSCTKVDEPALMKAMEIFLFMANEVTYDYDALDNNTDVSPYRAIMEKSGICQSFAPAYGYLLLQLGIDACPTGGLTRDNTTAHEWTLMKLNDNWYYADVTFANGDTWIPFMYFGITDDLRSDYGDYDPYYFNVGECNREWGRNFHVDDMAFAELWDLYSIESITYDAADVIVTGTDFNNNELTVRVGYK